MTRPSSLSLKAIVLLAAALFPAVRQVRVIAQRAAIYVEPDRQSTRIDVVRQGAVLNLLQAQKVKESWYYVSYVSSRYGGRMSGFIRDTAVEVVGEGGPAQQPPSAKEAPPAAKPVQAVPAVEPERPKPEPAPAPITVTALTVVLPRARRLDLPRRVTGPADVPWIISQPAASPVKTGPASVPPPARPESPKEKPAPPEIIVTDVLTWLPRARRLTLPRRAAVPQEIPWAVIEPPAPKPEPRTEPPEIIAVSVTNVTARLPRSRRLKLPRRPSLPVDAPWEIIPAPAPEPVRPSAGPSTPPAPAVLKPAASPPPPAKAQPVKEKTAPPPPATAPAPAVTKAGTEIPKVKKASPPETEPTLPARAARPAGRRARLGLGAGFGPSYGGAGGSLLLPLGGGLAFHAGYGVYPTTLVYSETDWVSNEALWSVGLRIYPLPSSDKIAPYIDAVYGGFIVEAAQVITGIYDYSFVYDRQQKTLQGPSLLAGLEFRLGRFVLSGGLGASYSLTDWEILKSRLFFAFEAGLGVRL